MMFWKKVHHFFQSRKFKSWLWSLTIFVCTSTNKKFSRSTIRVCQAKRSSGTIKNSHKLDGHNWPSVSLEVLVKYHSCTLIFDKLTKYAPLCTLHRFPILLVSFMLWCHRCPSRSNKLISQEIVLHLGEIIINDLSVRIGSHKWRKIMNLLRKI